MQFPCDCIATQHPKDINYIFWFVLVAVLDHSYPYPRSLRHIFQGFCNEAENIVILFVAVALSMLQEMVYLETVLP